MEDTKRTIALASFAITAALAFVVVITACYMWASGKEIPQALGVLLTATVTYVYTTLPNIVKTYTDKGV